MKLQDGLPDGVTVDGRFYKCDFDFRNVIEMMEILSREDLIQPAKEYKALKCIMKRPRNTAKVLSAVRAVLFPVKAKKAENGDKTRLTDFVQDAALIRAAFRQSYNIDLYREKLHWIEFSELLSEIPEGSRYAEIISIRARPMPAPTKYNQSEIAWLTNAKAAVALDLTEEEKKKQYEKQVQNVFDGLMKYFAGGSEK